MSRLFDRAYRLVVGTLEVKDLHVEFNVEKTLKPQPNKAEIKIYNLSRERSRQIEEAKEIPVQLDAGYVDNLSTIFLGTLRTGTTTRKGADLITLVSSGDGEKNLRTARASGSFKPGTPADKVLKSVAESIGVGAGNLNQAAALMKATQVAQAFTAGSVLYGASVYEMDMICKSFGLRWSVQGGKLQIIEIKKALDDLAVVLSGSTGLIGSPSVDNKGILRCQTLMIPDLFPGRKIVLDGEHLQGQYVVESTKHSGALRDPQPWFVDLEAKRY